jgi:hypothetical protein
VPDILDEIDAVLTWEQDSTKDAMRWHPGLFPPLSTEQAGTVRQVACDTGLDGYAAWLAVADVIRHGRASPYAELVQPHLPALPGAVAIEVTVSGPPVSWRWRAWIYRIPERWRAVHRIYAALHGYFWLPCVLCGRYSGGHEWRDIDGKSSTLWDADGCHGKGICPVCTRAGKGNWPFARPQGLQCPG